LCIIINTEQKLIIWDKNPKWNMHELCVYKRYAMCNILSSQKAAFTCKGKCSACIRHTKLNGERQEQRREEVEIKEFIIHPSITGSFIQKIENRSAGKCA
jgi:hypothetical protein